MRWFDIVRLQLLPAVIAARDPSENSIPTGVNVPKNIWRLSLSVK